MSFKNGLVIAKLCPLHKGHLDLLTYARDICEEELHVLIVDRPGHVPYDEFPVKLRSQWLAAEGFHASILEVESEFPDLDDERWALLTIRTLGVKPDALFSHEFNRDKGYALAMGAAFVVPPFPMKVSATMIRGAALMGSVKVYEDYLPLGVRQYYTKQGKL